MNTRWLLLGIALLCFSGIAARAADWGEVSIGNSQRMEVCLTLDGGGIGNDAYLMDQIMNVLEAKNVRVTTFFTTRVLPDVAAQFQRVVRNGYEIGNHTVTHANFTVKNPDGSYVYSEDYMLNSEILAAEQTIRSQAGGRTTRPWFRFPNGSRDQRALDLIRRAGYRSVYWTIDTIDWDAATTAAQIKSRVMAGLKPGAIILCHWAGPHTYEAISDVIDNVRAQGYEFVTLSELVAPTPANGLVVDNTDPGCSFVGAWGTSNWATTRYGTDYLYIDALGNGDNTVTWTKSLPTGNYDVSLWWSSDTSRPTTAPYTIYYSGGSKAVTINQRTNGGKWVSQGTFAFTAGTPARVVLTDKTSGRLVADAVKFQVVGSAPTITPSWTLDLGAPINSSPSVGDGVAFVGAENGNLYAINTTTGTPGTERWHTALGGAIHSRPQLQGGVLYVTTAAGSVAALNPADGRILWQVPVGAGELTSPSPTANELYVGSADGRIYRLSPVDGAITGASILFPGPIKSTPAVRNVDLVWVGLSDGRLCCLTSDLAAVRWTVASGTRAVDSSPFINWSEELLMAGSSNGTMLMVSAGNGMPMVPIYTGTPPFSVDSMEIAGSVSGSPWIDTASGLAYFGTSRGYVYGLEIASGLPAFQCPLRLAPDSGAFSGSPLVVAGPSGGKTLYLGSDGGRFYAIPTATPGAYSVYTGAAGIRFSSPAATGPTAADRVITTTSDGKVMAFPVL